MNKDNFISSSAIYMPFIFSCLTALHRPSHMMLKSKNGREYPHFLPDLNGKTSNFSPLCMMWTVDFCRIFFIILRKFPSTPNLLGFTHEWVLIFQMCLLHLSMGSCIFFFLAYSFLFFIYFIIFFIILKSLILTCIPKH